jgi:hypothetical protein
LILMGIFRMTYQDDFMVNNVIIVIIVILLTSRLLQKYTKDTRLVGLIKMFKILHIIKKSLIAYHMARNAIWNHVDSAMFDGLRLFY